MVAFTASIPHVTIAQSQGDMGKVTEVGAVSVFPEDFLWGATLFAHQVEGENYNNDWWRWEQRAGHVADGTTSGRAADHFARFEEDFDLARGLDLNALLVSIEWSRVQPVIDVFDDAALEHYARVLDALRARNIEPVCVLHDATLPAWLADAGGWQNESSVVHFEHYAERIGEVLGRRCRWWLPLYEPVHAAWMRSVAGVWPGKTGHFGRVLRHLATAHVRAYHALHGIRPDAMVGVSVRALSLMPLDEHRHRDVLAADRAREDRCHAFIDAVQKEHGGEAAHDFIGVSYFGRQIVRHALLRPRPRSIVFVDGEGHPEPMEHYQADPRGLRETLDRFARLGVPILITGNGIPTEQDGERCAYLLEHLWIVQRAIEAGLDIQGYFHHALLDGFSWHQGFSARYGLILVDWDTLARTPNGSALLYQDVCRNHELRMGALTRFCPGWRPPETDAR